MGLLATIFDYHGTSTGLNLTRQVNADPTLAGIRRRLIDELHLSDADATRVTEAILSRVLHRFGDHLVGINSALIDRIVALRNDLDDAYSGAMAYATTPGRGVGSASHDATLRSIVTKITDLEHALTTLGTPLHDVPPPAGAGDTLAPLHALITATTPTTARSGTVVRDVVRDVTSTVSATGRRARARILGGRYRFRRRADGGYFKRFADGSSAIFRIVDGRYHVELYNAARQRIGEAVEFAVLHTPYGRRPHTTALMQANHGYQNSTMTRLFGRYGYNGDAVPTMWMRDSRHGSPHGLVTAAQNGAKRMRNASGVTLEKIRNWTIADLRHAGMPDANIAEYLRAIDDHFMRNVYPNIPANRRAGLLGNWRAGTGL